MKANQFMLQVYAAQSGSISPTTINNNYINGERSSTVQILFSNTYLLIQVDNQIKIMEISYLQLSLVYTIIQSTISLGYFDSLSNMLYQFSDEIVINSLQNPQLNINFDYQKNLTSFIIQGYSSQEKTWNNTCNQKIQPFILNQNDVDIYVTQNYHQKFYFIFESGIYKYEIQGFSGPLMKCTLKMLNDQLGITQDDTLTKMNINIQQPFQITRFQHIERNGLEIFFAGVFNNNIYFYLCLNLTQCTLVYQDIKLENIKQMEIIFYQSILMVGVNQGINDIRIYQFNVNSNGSYKIIEFFKIIIYTFQAYKQFLFTYDNIIVLLENQNIIIQSLTSSDEFTLGDKEISQLFPNYDIKSINFKPIQMAMNVIDLSSILYINNQNSVIILVVQSTYEIIPYAILIVDYQIYQINIIVQKLILSYKCETNICFEEWNVLNLNQPQFIKILPSVQMQRGWQIVSDNLFLYVKSQLNTMYVFNPALSYHDSLYYEFNFSGDYFSSIAIYYYTLLFIENGFFMLKIRMSQSFSSLPVKYQQEQNYINQTLFYEIVQNSFQKSASTPNKLLSIINSLTEIKLPEVQELNSFIHVPQVINLDPDQQIQILSYDLMYQKSDFCYLQQYISKSNSIPIQNSSYIQTMWIFLINTQLFKQVLYNMSNQFYVSIFEENQIFWSQVYNQQDQFNCSMPLIYDQPQFNISQISQLCLTNDSWYLTIYQYYNQTINTTNQMLIGKNIQNVIKLMSIHNNTIFFIQVSLVSETALEAIYITNNINSFNNVSNLSRYRNYCQLENSIFYFTLSELKYFENYYLIMYLCQEIVYYYVGFVNENQQFIEASITQRLFDDVHLFYLCNAQLLEIQILTQLKDQLTILLTTTLGPSFIFQVSYFLKQENKFRFHMVFSELIQTIPPYGNYSLTQSMPILNGLMFFTYISNIDKVYAIYDLTSVHKNIKNPLLMKGGYNSSLPLPTNIAFNFTSIQEGGQFYELINNTINNYSVVGNAYLNCTIDSKKDYSVKLIAYNSFSQDTFIITYHVSVYQWYIGLLVFLAAIFTIASFVFWYNTRDLKTEDNFLEEVELELNE